MAFDFYFAGCGAKNFDVSTRIFHHNELASYHLNKRLIEKAISNLKLYRKDPEFIKSLKPIPYIKFGNPGKLFIDSGAFSMWTRGVEVNTDEYISWLNNNYEFIDLFGQVDKIPGKFGRLPTKDEIRAAAEGTIDNYFYMKERLINPDGLLYTFHFGEPFDLLERMLRDSPDMKYMAFGGLVGKSNLERDLFLERAFNIIKNSPNPGIKVHAFGVSDFDLVRKYPVYSSDSASWEKAASYGSILTDYGTVLVSDKQNNSPIHYKNRIPSSKLQEVEHSILSKYGFSFDDLKNSRDNRVYYNAAFFKDKINKLERVNCIRSRILFDVKK